MEKQRRETRAPWWCGEGGAAMNDAARLEHVLEKNLLPLCILAGLVLVMKAPGPGEALSRLHLTGWLVALILLGEGIKLDLSRLSSPRRYLKPVALGLAVAFLAFPAGAFLLAKAFSLLADYMAGLVLICSLPCSLASATVISSNAGGGSAAALLLLLALNLFGLAARPENLNLWHGGTTHVDDVDILAKLVLYLFLTVAAGQGLKRLAPGVAARIRPVFRYVPAACIGIIIYASCSEESRLMGSLSLGEVLHLLVPCLILHAAMLGGAYAAGRWALKLLEPVSRAVAVVCSEKPLSLAVALWSLSFAGEYPLAVFPLVMIYIVQVLLDSVWASHVRAGESRPGEKHPHSKETTCEKSSWSPSPGRTARA
ncbi:MAG: bile acid:sodium symporter [Desulfovibrionaceae bacterium]